MPNLDKTGPLGKGPMTGKRFSLLPRRKGRKQLKSAYVPNVDIKSKLLEEFLVQKEHALNVESL